MSKVSIIVPIYNVDKYLAKCLDSLINQTLKDIEIICIDDCSKDNSLEVLNKYAIQDSRIKIINLKENKGVSFARNKGLEIAKGEYIGFVDPDDYIDLDFYEKLYKKALVDDADIIKAALKVIKDDKEQAQYKNLNEKIKKNRYYFTCNFTSAIYKTALIKDNKIQFPNLPICEDRLFQIQALLKSKSFYVIDEPFYYYIMREKSATNTVDAKSILENMLKILDLLICILNNSKIDENNYRLIYDEFFISFVNLMEANLSQIEIFHDKISFINNLKYKNKFEDEMLCAIENKNISLLQNCIKKYKNAILLTKIRGQMNG